VIIAGMVEAGIGCWAGPLTVVSAAFDEKTELPRGVKDSKRLNMEQRENLIDVIYERAEWVVIKIAHASYINESKGIWSVWEELVSDLLADNVGRKAGKIIVDGERMISSYRGVTYEARADNKYREVSAASIVAKYAQTVIMEDIHDQYSKYGFDQHHGYGTALHKEMMEKYHPTPIHRLHYRPVRDHLRSYPGMDEDLRERSRNALCGVITRTIER